MCACTHTQITNETSVSIILVHRKPLQWLEYINSVDMYSTDASVISIKENTYNVNIFGFYLICAYMLVCNSYIFLADNSSLVKTSF